MNRLGVINLSMRDGNESSSVKMRREGEGREVVVAGPQLSKKVSDKKNSFRDGNIRAFLGCLSFVSRERTPKAFNLSYVKSSPDRKYSHLSLWK